MADALTLPRTEPQAASSAKRSWLREHLPIALILAAQASYTIRLIPVGYLSTDEARYIVAGHVLIHELFHGGGSPFYETFFSGAPDIYSPLAAMADYVGGVVAVRLMSMCFMLIATYLLYRTAERLVGYLAAVCSAGLFAGLGMTQVVGRNTIYDAMAFMLMAAAAYCAARSRDDQAKWLLLVPLLLFAAYFTKYMTFLFDPVVIAIASFGVGSWKESVRRLVTLGCTTLCAQALGAVLAGWAYLKGMFFSVFSRGAGTNAVLGAVKLSDHVIISRTWMWMGLLLVLSLIGAVAALIGRKNFGLVLVACALAGFLVFAEALHLHAGESMRRHDDLAALFAAIPAGYALALPANLVRRTVAWKRILAGAALLVVAAAWARYGQLPGSFVKENGFDTGNGGNPAPLALALKPYLVPGHEYLLSGLDNYSTIYYSHVNLPWYEYATDDNYIKYPIPGRGGDWSGTVHGQICHSLSPGCTYLEGPAAYQAAISAHAFAVIELEQRFPTIPTYSAIEKALHSKSSKYFHVLTRGYFTVWVYRPDYPSRSRPG